MKADLTALEITRERPLLGRRTGRLSYGCWRLAGTPVKEVAEKIDAALSVGANLIDTAAIYGFGGAGFGEAEAMFGEFIGDRPSVRDDLILVTKGGITPPLPYNSSVDHLTASCEASLKRLRTDRVDVFLIHRPDLLTGHEEAARALSRLVESGKVRGVGVSNYTVEQTRALQHFLDIPLAVTQPELSAWATGALFDGTLDHAQTAGLLPMAWSPLAGGALATGVVPSGADEELFGDLIGELDRLAETNDTSRECVALAWLLAHPAGIVPIIGTQSADRIRSAAGAFDVTMNRRDWYAILEASLGKHMP